MANLQSVTIAMVLPNHATLHVEATRLRTNDLEQEVVDIDRVFSFESVREAILGISSEVAKALEQAKPQKATVEFGIEVCLESGQLTAMLVKGSGKTNLKITLEWSGSSPSK
jgi:hypothetical protein